MSSKKEILKAFKEIANPKRDRFKQTGAGNIDLNNRKVVHNSDGSISTERSFSVNIDGKETLLPTIVNGKKVSEKQAIQHYINTGEHLGKFNSPEDADRYAEALHRRQMQKYGRNPTRNRGNIK